MARTRHQGTAAGTPLRALPVSGLLAGAMLVAMGLLRLGSLIEFVPYRVTNGFTASIAVVIATLQIKDFLGLTLSHNPEHFFDRIGAMVEARGTANPWEPVVGRYSSHVPGARDGCEGGSSLSRAPFPT